MKDIFGWIQTLFARRVSTEFCTATVIITSLDEPRIEWIQWIQCDNIPNTDIIFTSEDVEIDERRVTIIGGARQKLKTENEHLWTRHDTRLH